MVHERAVEEIPDRVLVCVGTQGARAEKGQCCGKVESIDGVADDGWTK